MKAEDFKQLNEKPKEAVDYRLDIYKPVIVMLDGRAFSKFCKRFSRPFDSDFMEIMNKVALHLCKEIPSCVCAYVQSDEISLFLRPCVLETDAWFGYRINKLCSIIASMASVYFNKLFIKLEGSSFVSLEDFLDKLEEQKFPVFDCKAWNVDNLDRVKDWFAYRQSDCVRNAIQQIARSEFSHSQLMGKNCKELEEMLSNTEKALHNFTSGEQFGRFISKKHNNCITEVVDYIDEDDSYQLNRIYNRYFQKLDFDELLDNNG